MHAMKRLAVAATVAALALAGCGSGSPAESEVLSSAAKVGPGLTFAISGTVGGAVADGVSVSLIGRTASGAAITAATTTNARGRYAFKNLQNGTYTVTPTQAGYVFSPPARDVTVSGADATGQDFTSAIAPTTFAISGIVSGATADGVTIWLAPSTGAQPLATITDVTGRYTFTDVPNGAYTVTPEKSGYVFSPASLDVTVGGADVIGQDFTASVATYVVSGTVTGDVAEGVTVTLSWSATGYLEMTTTDAAGRFAFPGVVDGPYILQPEKTGYVFSPNSRGPVVSGSDVTGQDFVASALHIVSGTVSGVVAEGVTVTLSSSVTGLLQVTSTDSTGHFGFAGVVDGTYTVKPIKSGYVLSPTTVAVTVSGSDVPGVDFIAAFPRYSISGTVLGAAADVQGVTVSLTAGTSVVATTTTDVTGHFAFTGLLDGAYTVTPTKTGYLFSPVSQVVTVAGADVTAQTIFPTAVYSISGTVSGATLEGVTVSVLSSFAMPAPSAPAMTSTDAAGSYRVTVPRGSYTVIAAKAGYRFSPAARSVALTGGDVAGQDFASSVEPYAPVCSADGWCWEAPAPQGNPLNGVWASSPSDVWLVGAAGTALHWDGNAWLGVATGTTKELRAAWGSASNDIWVVGGDPSIPASTGVVLHWDGSAWSTAITGTSALTAVWGSSANDVWAAGYSGTILHWNGSSWSATSGTTTALSSIWGSGANDVWAVGTGATLHWDGSTWSSVPGASGLTAVWGASANDVWGATQYGWILHWNGTAWSSVVSTGTTAALTAIWGSSANDVWVVGATEPYTATAPTLHWDGVAWSTVTTGTAGTLGAIGGTSAGDVWVAGFAGTILHWDGISFASVARPVPPLLLASWGSSASDVWVVGHLGWILHWDGTAWSNVPSGTTALLQGVWGSSSTDVWAVGGNTILHWDGRSWSIALTNAPSSLGAVWGSAANDVWAVGGTTSLHWDGTA